MTEFVFKLPDLGEGTVDAEVVEWRVRPGYVVAEGDVIVDVTTEKANVEIPAPVGGTVVRIAGGPGDRIAVGAELAAIRTEVAADELVEEAAGRPTPQAGADDAEHDSMLGDKLGTKVLASPALRRRAREAGVDLSEVTGSGFRGRVLDRDLQAFVRGRVEGKNGRSSVGEGVAPEGQRIVGVRRRIAERMSQSKREIPHFSYVEEVDVTELEALRHVLNERDSDSVHLTLLPFIAFALIRALQTHPECNARYDAERQLLHQSVAVHLGIATHTAEGLMVPVVRDAQGLGLWELAGAIQHAAEAARAKRRKASDLVGSTITVTSLGRLGGLATTPIINYPEVAIIGVNRSALRPVVKDGGIAVRKVMNVSSSFDHRFVDGYDAASLVQELKTLLECPGTMFLGSATGV